VTYRVYLCGDEPCPNDPEFVHRMIFGHVCVPKTFSDRTGRAKGHRQTPTDIGLPYPVSMWDGGCDAAGVTTANKLAEHARREPGRTIVLEIEG
jgi:hypothetical protein